MEEQVILVDEGDRQIGVAEKLKAHQEASLHRAFSIFVLNSQNQLLLQKRAKTKYHSGGLWTNTCCSHPRPEEVTLLAAHRRLKEEMGFDCKLTEIFSFTYKIKLDRDLFEHEFDHVLLGRFDGEPNLNLEEAEDWRWMAIEDLMVDIKVNSHLYTYWLQTCIDKFVDYLNS